ncbi:hypothetical protein [Achromobacter pulmonis]|uniref:hypothetical protein n=1 Tax=Achromobacter pulmonis TaxID=1389932 RepID=UPI002159E475|nr:hypothetical protein [Achromobacter pulmonis]
MDTTPMPLHAIPAGQWLIEADVARLIVRGALDVVPYLRRHLADDWGDLTHAERQENEHAVANGGEIFSAYRVNDSLTLWIVSEWDRSMTTLLLPPSGDSLPERSDGIQGRISGDIEF